MRRFPCAARASSRADVADSLPHSEGLAQEKPVCASFSIAIARDIFDRDIFEMIAEVVGLRRNLVRVTSASSERDTFSW